MAEVDGNIGEPVMDPPVDHDGIDQNEDEDEEQTTEPELDDAEGHGLDMHHGIDQTVDHEFVHALEQGLDESADQGDEIVHELEQAIGHNADHHTEHSTEDAEDQTADTFDEEGKGNDQEAAAVTAERRWPGWPGESVFRMLVPAQKVGGIIGRKGEFIKKIVEETRARVKILDGPPGTTERVVMVSGKEEPDSLLPPALDGLLRVHKRVVDGLDGDSSHPPGTVSKVSTRLLVPASQAGNLIGKQGGTVKSIQETAGCMVKVLGSEELPVFALQDDRVVELVGQPAGVHKAVELIASHLRKFLVDRSIIQVFEMQMANPQIDHVPPPHQSWGPPQGLPPPNAGGGLGYGHTPQYMPPPRQLENYYPPPDMPPPMEKTPHQGISAYGREAPPVGVHASSNTQIAPSMITQITQQMQIPLSFADAVIGTAGASISYIRRASGATVTIQETRGAPGEMTVEISGSASQVQAAQQLVQNFMAEAGHTQPQTGGATDQGYNPYAAHSSMYASPQNPSHGGYGSAYGTNYGY